MNLLKVRSSLSVCRLLNHKRMGRREETGKEMKFLLSPIFENCRRNHLPFLVTSYQKKNSRQCLFSKDTAQTRLHCPVRKFVCFLNAKCKRQLSRGRQFIWKETISHGQARLINATILHLTYFFFFTMFFFSKREENTGKKRSKIK